MSKVPLLVSSHWLQAQISSSSQKIKQKTLQVLDTSWALKKNFDGYRDFQKLVELAIWSMGFFIKKHFLNFYFSEIMLKEKKEESCYILDLIVQIFTIFILCFLQDYNLDISVNLNILIVLPCSQDFTYFWRMPNGNIFDNVIVRLFLCCTVWHFSWFSFYRHVITENTM